MPDMLGSVKTIFTPRKWFKERPELQAESTAEEERSSPVPGVYKHILGRGWFLAAKIVYHGDDKTLEPVSPLVHVTYSKVLHRYLFDDEYARRKAQGHFLGGPAKTAAVGFFRVDDVAWVNCWDEEGNFLSGPYKRYVPDAESKKFRPMTRLDDVEYQEKKKKRRREERQTLAIPRELTNNSTSTTSTVYSKLWDADAGSGASASSSQRHTPDIATSANNEPKA